jgi:hypothetical protein
MASHGLTVCKFDFSLGVSVVIGVTRNPLHGVLVVVNSDPAGVWTAKVTMRMWAPRISPQCPAKVERAFITRDLSGCNQKSGNNARTDLYIQSNILIEHVLPDPGGATRLRDAPARLKAPFQPEHETDKSKYDCQDDCHQKNYSAHEKFPCLQLHCWIIGFRVIDQNRSSTPLRLRLTFFRQK